MEGPETTGGEILAQLVNVIRRYIALTAAEAVAIALWVVHTHVFKAAWATPYLAITSAEKQCGKSRLLELLEMLVAEPWLTGSVSAAVLYRTINELRPTLLLDESDAAFNGNREYAEALRGVLNNGHRRGGRASRCEQVGTNFVRRDFETFCPKAIAGIGKLPDTVADRSIPIRLKRKLPGKEAARWRRREVEPETSALRAQVAAWTATWADRLAEMKPALPDSLSDRQQDGVEPLLAIADAAGGEWPERGCAALVEILAGAATEDQSTGVGLLGDIRGIFNEFGRDKLPSQELLGKLVQDETLPWGEFTDGRPLSLIKLASLLKPFGIQPGTRRDGPSTFKGYHKDNFADAWARYLPTLAPRAVTPSQPARILTESSTSKASHTAIVTAAEHVESPIDMRVVTAVTGSEQGDGYLEISL